MKREEIAAAAEGEEELSHTAACVYSLFKKNFTVQGKTANNNY